jgi:hypothetical protein
MVKKLNPSFVARFANKLKVLLSGTTETITAEQFQGEVTEAANEYLNEIYGVEPSAARSAIAQSTPEAECAKAIKARVFYGIKPEPDDRISHYKTQAGIDTAINLDAFDNRDTLGDKKIQYEPGNTYNTRDLIVNWISKTNMLLPDATGRKRQQAVEFTPNKATYCGKCWICMTDVMSYSGPSNQWYDRDDNQVEAGTQYAVRLGCKTPCGDCEHVSAIMASYIAGMLTSGGFANVYWASYYVACVECNRRKSNFIGVNLNATDGWQVDDSGVNAIVDAIFPMNGVDQHASEYNPIRNALSDKYNNMTPDKKIAFRGKVKAYIVDGTRAWCGAANTNMNKATATTKHIKMSFNVSKIIVAITGHLNVITGPLEKRANKAKPGPGKASATGKKQGKVVKSSQSAQVGSKLKPQPRGKRGGGPFDNDDEYSYIVHWNNLLDNEDEYENEYEDEYENEYEDDVTFEARMRKYRNVTVDYISTIYGQRLFEQYQSDTETFKKLMENLSTSMNDVLKPIPNIEPGEVASRSTESAGEKSIFVFPPTAPSTPPPAPKQSMEITPIKTGNRDDPPMQILKRMVTEPGAGSVYAPLTQPRGAARVGEADTQDPNYNPDDAVTTAAQVGEEAGTQNQETPPSTPPPKQQFARVTASPRKRDRTSSGLTAYANPKLSKYHTVGQEDTQAEGLNLAGDIEGGSRLNKRHSKNRTKRISYIKHKQTRKNQHSRKTNKK